MNKNIKIIGIALASLCVVAVASEGDVQSESDKGQADFFSVKGVWEWLLKPAPKTEPTPEPKSGPKSESETSVTPQPSRTETEQPLNTQVPPVPTITESTEPEQNQSDNSGQKTVEEESTENKATSTPQGESNKAIENAPTSGPVNRPEENKKLLQLIKKHQEEVSALCEEMGGLLSSVSVKGCLSHNFSHGSAYSVKGRALVYKDVFPNGVSPEQAMKLSKVLVIGGIHGDEYSSFSIIFRWLERLAGNKEDIQQYWRFIPAANPDGLLSFKPAQRMNANGVDLNRNFMTNDWQAKAIEYWEQKTGKDERRNPGKSASSEPETVWLSELIAQWEPDVIVSVHAPYGILDFDSTEKRNIKAPDKIGMLHLKLLGTYPGSLGRYAALNRGIPVLTMELPHAGIMPSKDEQNHLWQDLQKWLNKNI